LSEDYDDIINEAKESLSEAMIYVFQTLKSLEKRILALEQKSRE